MWEDIFVGFIGQVLAFALIAGVVCIVGWVLKKIFPKSEGKKSFSEGHKYNKGDEIEAITKDGVTVKGIISNVGSQSYIVKFEKPVGFKGKDCKLAHSLYEGEVDAIVNKVLKADRLL
jgi:hypothetical protein